MDINKIIKDHKTLCCKSTWTVKGRANYICDKCGKDVTMEIIYLVDAAVEK